jgi:hypothetical protein
MSALELACLEKSSVAISELNYRGYNIFGRHRFARQLLFDELPDDHGVGFGAVDIAHGVDGGNRETPA